MKYVSIPEKNSVDRLAYPPDGVVFKDDEDSTTFEALFAVLTRSKSRITCRDCW